MLAAFGQKCGKIGLLKSLSPCVISFGSRPWLLAMRLVLRCQNTSDRCVCTPTSFVVKGEDYTLTFVTAPSGAITKLVLDTGNEKFDLIKKM
jgi:hypothetical protein